MTPEDLHRRLLDPHSYPESTGAVDYRETHISRVYLTDHFVYKLKKAVDLGFLDFSTLERRRFFCTEELHLNRRFAPETYLEVVELCDDGGVLRFGGPGRPCDYAVKMRRLPDARMLDRLLDEEDPGLPGEIERLARHLAPLLAACPPCRESAAGGYAAVLAGNCAENLRQTAPAIGTLLSAEAHRLMGELTGQGMARLAPLFAAREARGLVRDGHGDLHSRNICLSEPIVVYDCIEFAARFRIADVAAELAFLLMDLDYRGRRDLAARFLAAWQEADPDAELAELLPFCKSYRAWVRGKVEYLLSVGAAVEPQLREEAAERARRYFNLALGYHLEPRLVLVGGLMGVGKSTFARALAEAAGGVVLRSDVVRKELAGLDPAAPSPAAFRQGLYDAAMTARTYAGLRERARRELAAGELVIVDASFMREADRRDFLALAAELGRPAGQIYLHCPVEVTLERLDRRQAEGRDASDGRRELLAAQAADYESFSPGPHRLTLDTSEPLDANVQAALCWLLAGG